MHINLRHAVSFLAAVTLAGVLGCGARGPKTHPVAGRVEIDGGDSSALAGSLIEAVLDSDTTVRASGEIKADGSFTLETLQAGVIQKGAVAGNYKARIILTDDEPAARKRAAKALDPRSLKFETSGLSIQVPASGDITLTLPKRK